MKNITLGSNAGGIELVNGLTKTVTNNPQNGNWTPPELIKAPLEAGKVQAVLTDDEMRNRDELESIVKNGWSNFLVVGRALIKIRGKKLYWEDFGNFETYCRDRLGISRQYAYNLLDSTEVYDDLSAIADISKKPANEAQARPLIAVPKAKRVIVWNMAIAEAGDQPITAKIVKRLAAPFIPNGSRKNGLTKKKSTPRHPKLQVALELLARIEALPTAKGLLPMLAELRLLLTGIKCAESV